MTKKKAERNRVRFEESIGKLQPAAKEAPGDLSAVCTPEGRVYRAHTETLDSGEKWRKRGAKVAARLKSDGYYSATREKIRRSLCGIMTRKPNAAI